MSGTPIDLSAYKVIAGEALAAAKIANGFTAIETYTTSAIDPASMLQKAATIGQALVWDGTKWAPGAPTYPIGPTMIGPTVTPTTGNSLVANNAYLLPIANLVAPTTITRICFAVTSGGATGNMDVGVYYSDDDATFTRLVSKGSTATPVSGAGTNQSFTVASTTLTPVAGRRWYFAIGCSSATPFFAGASSAQLQFVNSFLKTTSFPLPASLTGMSTPAPNPPMLYGLV